MTKFVRYLAMMLAGVMLLLSAPLLAIQKNGAPAHNFTLINSFGKAVKLSQFRGRTVVLEWHSPQCPFVGKHYISGNMQKTQKVARQKGVVWLTINSSGRGKQGYLTGKQAQSEARETRSRASHYLLDHSGRVGKAYGARTTPQIYIVNTKGIVVYQGAIDNKPSANPKDIKTARNHVIAALNEIKAGKPISVKRSRSYGCAIKYTS